MMLNGNLPGYGTGKSEATGEMPATRLNLGCGSTVIEGWINIDKSPGPLLDRFRILKKALFRLGIISTDHMTEWPRGIVRRDIRRRLPFQDRTVDAIYTSHTLEHLYLDEAASVLVEARRVLRPGGVIRVALPDAELLAREFLHSMESDAAEATVRFNEGLRAHPLTKPKTRQLAVRAVGGNVHRWQPTAGLVFRLLEGAGFEQVSTCHFREGALPDLHRVETRKESFFLEAVRPVDQPI